MSTTNYMTPTQAQLIGGQMMPLDVTQAMPVQNAPAMGGVPQMSPQQLSGIAQQPQFPSNYQDSAGVSGSTLNQYGIAPGNGGDGIMGLGQAYAFGGGGNPLGLSSGQNFSPQDISALQGAFNG